MPAMKPEERLTSARNGMRLFLSKGEAGCIGCHTDFGRGPNYSYDAWGTINKPADLTSGRYRGGRRPIDLYYRIHSGINGVTMPASKDNLAANDIWDLVNFLRILPYPKMREAYGIHLESSESTRVAEGTPRRARSTAE